MFTSFIFPVNILSSRFLSCVPSLFLFHFSTQNIISYVVKNKIIHDIWAKYIFSLNFIQLNWFMCFVILNRFQLSSALVKLPIQFMLYVQKYLISVSTNNALSHDCRWKPVNQRLAVITSHCPVYRTKVFLSIPLQQLLPLRHCSSHHSKVMKWPS